MVDYPKDWEKVKLSALVKNITTGKLDASHMVRNGKYRFYTCAKNYYYINDYAFDGEALLISGNGEYVGYVHYYKGKFNAYQRTYVLMDFSCNSIFLKYYLDYFLESQINSEMKDGNTPYIVKSTLEDFLVTIPPLPEQKSIAETLMTFDRHIENLERLIEKKKMIRDGAVEDLMTGKTRLEGFDGEWKEIDFSNYFTKLGNNTLSRDKLCKTGKVSNIHYGDVLIKYGPVLDNVNDVPKIKENVKFDKRYLLKCNDVIFADTAEDETVGKAVQIGKINEPIVSGLHTIPCRPNYRTANRFMGYYVNSKIFHEQLLPHITGIKVSSISKKSIDSTKLNIPSDIKEQEAIASILTSMDEEIENVEKEKTKIEKIKVGAMDDLLTGKIRLI